MLISRSKAALFCLFIITLVFVAINIIEFGRPLNFYGSFHVFQFMMGCGAYYVWREIRRYSAMLAVLRRGRFVLLAITAGLLLACCWASDYYRDSSLIAVTVASGLFVLAVVSLEEYSGIQVKSRLVNLLGDASYSIYLVHRFVYAPMARKIFPHLTEQPVWAKLLAFIPVAAVVIVISVLVHLLFEKPVTRFLSDLWRRVSGASRDEATVASVEWGRR